MRAATSALPYALFFVPIAACNAISGIGDLTRSDSAAPQTEAGAPCNGANLTSDANNCGTCGNACAQGDFCSSSSCTTGCTGGLLYVSPTGSDTASGCTTDAPLKTIAHALTLAKAQGNALVQEVHVCKGIYKEPQITLDFKSSLRGAYDCTSWKRTGTFGSPTFDGTNATEIDSTTPVGATSITTMVVGGAAVDASVVVDGWKIQGSSVATTTIALGLIAGSPTIKDDQITGGAPSEATAPNASIGIQIGAGGSPEIVGCRIDGGGGKSTSTNASAVGSAGILIASDSGNPNVHDDDISGGSGSAPAGTGSIGIAVSGGTFASAIRNNTINGGSGKVTTSGTASVGISSVASTSVEVDGNTVSGGSGSCAAATGVCTVFGISAGLGGFTAKGNKLYAGDATGSVTGGSIALSGSGLTSFVAQNNMIHGGNKTGDALHGSAIGIELTQITGPQLLNNTIYSGNAGSSMSTGADSIVIEPAVSGIIAQNNLIMTSGNRDAGIVVACTPELVSKFQNNVFLTESAYVNYGGGGTGSCGGVAKTFAFVAGGNGNGSAESFFTGSATAPTVNGNRAVTLDCSSDASCTSDAVCNSAANCEAAIVTGWNKPDNGFTTLFGDGWKIGTKCAVSQGGLDLSATLKTDFYGAARTAPLSAGAHEQDATCAN